MIKQMSKKQLLIGGAVAALVVVGGISTLVAGSGKKDALRYYDDFKDRYFLQDVLSEGEVSYSMFSGNLTVANPEIRMATVQTNGAQQFLRGITGLLESSRSGSGEDGLGGWVKYQLNAAAGRYVAGIYLKADALKISHSGDSKDGKVHVQLQGMELANPYISRKGDEVVLVSDVGDEIQPRAELASNGQATRSQFSWGTNLAVRQPVTGAFLVNSTGDYGTKVDLDFTIKRSSDGEGSMEFVVTHRNDGSKIGEIVRKADFETLPELDEVQNLLKDSLSGFIVGAYSARTGQTVLQEAVSSFARKTKVKDYSVAYSGFDPLKDAYSAFQKAVPGTRFTAFCDEVGLSSWSSDFGAKGKQHSDSECAIGEKLVSDGKFKEQYEFQEGKSLFAALFVSKAYELETN